MESVLRKPCQNYRPQESSLTQQEAESRNHIEESSEELEGSRRCSSSAIFVVIIGIMLGNKEARVLDCEVNVA